MRYGGAPEDPDLPDNVSALYVSTKNTWQDAENLDDTHGYTTYIWIPEETFKVDVMKLHIYAEKFRAYSKSALDGGAQTKTSTETTPSHKHNVVIGAETSGASGKHRHMMFEYISDTPGPINDMKYGCRTSGAASITVDMDGTTDIDYYTEEEIADHTHSIDYGTKTSESGGGKHSHDVTIDDHTHPIDFGIYEEAITGRTLSAVLYDPDDVELKDFGVVLTGEDDVTLDLSEYFATLTYGMYRIVLSASARLRARLVFYELCKMYAQF